MTISIIAERLRQENLKKADESRKKSDKNPAQNYEEREKRVRDAIQLREPDRVPVRLETHAFPARYAGIHVSASFYDPDAWKEATKRKNMTSFLTTPPILLCVTFCRALMVRWRLWPNFHTWRICLSMFPG